MKNKIALLADLHFGVKKSNKTFLENQLKFYYDEFIPYCKDNDISDVVILGDVFDNRNSLNSYVLNKVYELFDTMNELFNIYVLLGNHDIYYSNSLGTHSIKFLKKFSNIRVFEDIELIDDNGKKFLFVPWIVDREDFRKRVANKNIECDVCFGHFEINGFALNNKKICDNGFNSKLFYNNYVKTFTGHFHLRNVRKINNSEIIYVGSPYEMTRSDSYSEKGFCVLDTNTLEYEFINSQKTMKHIVVEYPNIPKEEDIKNNHVDLVITIDDEYDSKKNKEINKYIEKLNSYNPLFPINVSINNEKDSTLESNIDDVNINDIGVLLREYVSELEISNKDEVQKYLLEKYEENKGN